MKPQTAEEVDAAATEAWTRGVDLLAEAHTCLHQARVLDGYAKHLRDGGAPIVTTADDFREHIRAAPDGASRQGN